MECEEARRLLAQYVQPGTGDPQRARLGFHLAGCPACRAVRGSIDGSAERLLDTLLTTPLPQDQFLAAPAPAPMPPQRLRLMLRAAGAVVVLLLLVLAGRTISTIYQIRQNIGAMVVSPTPALAIVAAAPRGQISVSTAQQLPSATPTQHGLFLGAAPPATPTPTLFVPPTLAPTVPPAPAAGDAITVLLIGNDLRLDEQGPARADSIMLARIDPQHGRIALLSLTRDLMAEIPGYGYARVNAANTWGGPDLERQTISNLFQIPIDYYAEINFAGFIDMVDSLGGVTVPVDKEIYQPGWELHFMPGPNHMDGLTALRYSRIRMPDSDYDRIKRQQTVLLAIATQAREQLSIWNLQGLQDLTSAMRNHVQTDMPEDRMIGLAWAFRNMSLDSIERYSVEGLMVSTGVVPGDYYAQVPNDGVIAELRGKLLGDGGQK